MHCAQNFVVDREIRDSFRVSRLSATNFERPALISVIYNRIFIVTRATGRIQIDHTTYPVAGEEIFLISKGQLFSFLEDTILDGFEIVFGDCFWERTPASTSNCKAVLFNNAALRQQLPLNDMEAGSILPVCELLLSEYTSDDYANKLDAMAAYLKVIMIKLANIRSTSNNELNSFDNRLYQQFLELVSTRVHLTREVGDFAGELSVSARKLSDVCKQKSGQGAKEIINGFLVAEAKRSLQFSVKLIKQIAYDLSFATPEQFSHFFKKNTDLSPVDYRNMFVNIGR